MVIIPEIGLFSVYMYVLDDDDVYFSFYTKVVSSGQWLENYLY